MNIKARFQKTLIFPTDFNDFIKVLVEFWVDLGLLWDHFWHMRVTLDPFWVHFGGSRLKLASRSTKLAAKWPRLAQVGGLGATARGRTQFYSSIHIKKKSRPTTRIRRGATEEPPRSHQGSHFRIQGSQGCPLNKKRILLTKNRSWDKGHGRI